MKENTEISERILQVVEYLDVTKSQFAKDLGYNRSQNIYDIVNGKSKPSFDFFNKLYNSEYSETINSIWLLTGKGVMLVDKAEKENVKEVFKLKTDYTINEQNIPLYNLEASAGLVDLFQNHSDIKPIDTIHIPNLPKCDGAVFVTGDSMYPLLKSGDIVAYKQIQDLKNDIYWGEMYLISVEVGDEEFISVKYIQKSEEGNEYIKLVSQNSNHQPKDIPLKKVRAMAIVKASIRINSMR